MIRADATMAPIGGGLAPAEVQAIAAIGGAPPPAAAPAAARVPATAAPPARSVRAARPAALVAAAPPPLVVLALLGAAAAACVAHALLRVLDSPARNTLAASAAAFAAGSLADGRVRRLLGSPDTRC